MAEKGVVAVLVRLLLLFPKVSKVPKGIFVTGPYRPWFTLNTKVTVRGGHPLNRRSKGTPVGESGYMVATWIASP